MKKWQSFFTVNFPVTELLECKIVGKFRNHCINFHVFPGLCISEEKIEKEMSADIRISTILRSTLLTADTETFSPLTRYVKIYCCWHTVPTPYNPFHRSIAFLKPTLKWMTRVTRMSVKRKWLHSKSLGSDRNPFPTLLRHSAMKSLSSATLPSPRTWTLALPLHRIRNKLAIRFISGCSDEMRSWIHYFQRSIYHYSCHQSCYPKAILTLDR